jgi:prepilin-type N-terminal cleavage/methylation domain-containing protein
MKRNGFSLIESLIVMTVGGALTAGTISMVSENANEEAGVKFLKEASDIVSAVDKRIAIDGYSTSTWGSTSWGNESEIVNKLIKKELTSKELDSCSGGEWLPSDSTKEKDSIITCNLWEFRKPNGIEMSAELGKDSVGLIKDFSLLISFSDEESFAENFKYMKRGMIEAKSQRNKEENGVNNFEVVSLSTEEEITSNECISSPTDCAFKLSYNRIGGNEYLKADGSNSILGEHLTFMEANGDSPLKCVKWSAEEGENPTEWDDPSVEEDCGIGIYLGEDNGVDPAPVMVDVVADSGTFKNVTLNRNCTLYNWNSTTKEVEDSGKTTPCGMLNNGSEVIQVVDNTIANIGYILELQAETAVINTANINNIKANKVTVNTLTTNTLNTTTLNVLDLIVNGESTFEGKVTFNEKVIFNEDVSVKQNVNVAGDLIVDGNVNINGTIDFKDTTIDGTLTVKGESILEGNATSLGDTIVSDKLTTNGLTTGNIEANSDVIAGVSMKAPDGQFDNINAEIADINAEIAALCSKSTVKCN